MGLGALALATTAFFFNRPDTRSVGPAQPTSTESSSAEDARANSTGLFIGVREFRHDPSLEVPYAVDDAVDLAYMFSLGRAGLVPPDRIVLALAGKPQKEESRERLQKLREAGAKVEDATSDDIGNLLDKQIKLAGQDGTLVLSIATHGFLDNGDAYILGSASKMGDLHLRLTDLFDAATRTKRSVIFVDACRDRIGETSRGAGPDSKTAAPHIRRMAKYHGQVIFYAAAPGQYAYDDYIRQNGVFTATVLDGLNCKASVLRDTVLVESLNHYVEREVHRWIKENKDLDVAPATQIIMDGGTGGIGLSTCKSGRCASVVANGSQITVYNDNQEELWTKDLHKAIMRAELADFDMDPHCEVVVGLDDRIDVFSRKGTLRWSQNAEGMKLREFSTSDLLQKREKHVIALWVSEDGSASRVTTMDGDGEIKTYDHAGPIQHIEIGRPTNQFSRKIVVADSGCLYVLDPLKLNLLWRRPLGSTSDAIHDIRIGNADNNPEHDIVVVTKNGTTTFDFDGKILREKGDVQWMEIPAKRKRSERARR